MGNDICVILYFDDFVTKSLKKGTLCDKIRTRQVNNDEIL